MTGNPGPLQPRSKVWLERDGKVVLSDWRARLLEAIAETGSLAAAAARLDVPYRTAWTRTREIEAGLGFRVLDSYPGGADGGHSRLTPDARRVLEQFRRVSGGVAEMVDDRFDVAFGR